MFYDKSSTGARAYLSLAGEILRREEQSISADQEVIEDAK